MAGGVTHDTHRRLSSRNAASSSSFIVAKGCGMACDKFCRFHKVRALFPTHTHKQRRCFIHTHTQHTEGERSVVRARGASENRISSSSDLYQNLAPTVHAVIVVNARPDGAAARVCDCVLRCIRCPTKAFATPRDDGSP